ncbi:hypothetical protein SLA2020_284660 [Shorea laevis]
MTEYYLFLFVCFLLVPLLLILYFNKLTTGRRSQLPRPPALPVIGHLHLVGGFFHKTMQNLATQYGPIFSLRLGFANCVVVSSAPLADEIFKTHDIDFAQHPKLALSDDVPYGNCGFFSSPYGDYWRFLRKLVMTELLSSGQLERSRVVREEELRQFLRGLLESAEKKEVVNVGVEIMKLANNSLCRIAMSTRCSEKAHGFAHGFDELLERLLKEHEDDQIRKIRENEDFMDILLKVCRDGKAEAKMMTRNHLKAFLVDIFIGGTGTLEEAIVWVMAELINRPNVFHKLREEIRSVVGSTRLVQESDFPSLPYLQAVVKETLRLYPPFPVTPRECIQSCKIGGFEIPQKTAVLVNLYAIMRDPELWDNPNEFLPERFLASDEQVHKQDRTHVGEAFLTFGAGRRACPGSKLGLIMMQNAVAAMVQCFDWKFHGDDGHNGNKINMEVGKGAFLRLAQPLTCLPVVHFNPFASSI